MRRFCCGYERAARAARPISSNQFEPGRPTANTLMGGGGVVNDFA
ncbi:hypothetical protein SCB29_38275 [Paraburkholderia sp. SIMBA_055]